MRLRDSSVFPLISLLEGSDVTLFYFQLVEDGCWWLPALRSGQTCFGSYALRPSEFVLSLNEIMEEIRVNLQVPAELQPVLVAGPEKSGGKLSLSWSNGKPAPMVARSARAGGGFAGRRAG
jgi:hypothetical protein